MRGTLWLMILLSAACAAQADEAAPLGRLSDTVVPTHYQLDLSIDPRQPQFSGAAQIEVTLAAPVRTLWLHGLGLKVKTASVTAGGRTLAARYEEVDHVTGVARLVTATAVPAGPATLRFEYVAPFQSSPQGLYRSRTGKDWYAFSQMEAIDARRVFPGFDEPRFKTPFDITVRTHGKDLAVSNAPELEGAAAAGAATVHHFQTTKPLPTYLIAFAVGPLQIIEATPVAPNAVRHEPLPLRIIGVQGDAARFRFAAEQAPELIRRLEAYFGIAFPYPKIDLIASPIHLGAMENAGAIIFAESYLALPAVPTPRQQSNFGSVAAHELSHQWFGDLVTPAWWDDIWLNESFAEWMGSKIANDWRPQLGIEQEQLDATLGAMNTDALSAGRPIHQPVATNAQIATTFDDITYQKGAGVIGMVESYLGEERFQRGVRLHLTRHAYGTATAAQFFGAMAEGSGDAGVIAAFESFVNQPGVPLISVASAADGSLTLSQSRYRPLGPGTHGAELPWKIPFCAAFYAGNTPGKKACTLLTTASGTLAVPAALRGAVVQPNANGAGYYRFTVDAKLSQALFAMAAALPPREAMTLADSTAAAFDAGRLPFAGLFQAARALAAHPDRTTALSLGFRLQSLHDRVATPEERALLERALVGLYGPRLRQLGYEAAPGRYAADPPAQQLLRRQLLSVVGITGRDAPVRAALADNAQRSVTDPAAVDALLRWRVWAVGLQERGAPLFGPLKTLALGSDAQVRQDAGNALGYAPAPVAAAAALSLTLDPSLDPDAIFSIVFTQMREPATREGAWAWLGTHREALLARVPVMFQTDFAALGNSFCSNAQRASFNSVLGATLRPLNGGEIAVDRVLESIDDCIALRASLANSITTTLQAAPH
jgi:aminopeptidase N